MATGSDNKKPMVEIGAPNSMAPSVGTGSMMSVGMEEEDVAKNRDDLLFDDEPTTVEVSIAEVRKVIRQEISEVVKKSGGKYVLYSKHKKGGKRKKLGTHSSKASAERQERAIHAHKG